MSVTIFQMLCLNCVIFGAIESSIPGEEEMTMIVLGVSRYSLTSNLEGNLPCLVLRIIYVRLSMTVKEVLSWVLHNSN